MKTFIQYLLEAPAGPGKPPSDSSSTLGVPSDGLLSNPTKNVLNVPQAKTSSGSMGFRVDPLTQNRLRDELLSSGRNPTEYNSTYSAATDLRSDENNQQNQTVQFRLLQSMFEQLPENSGMNGTMAMDMANTLSINGFKVDEIYDAMIKIYQEISKSQGVQIDPYRALNSLIASKQQSTSGKKEGITPNINTFDPLADLKKYKLFAPVEYQEVVGDEVGEDQTQGGFGGAGIDAIYGS